MLRKKIGPYVPHLKRSNKRGNTWIFPKEEDKHLVQQEHILKHNITASYASSSSWIRSCVDIGIFEEIEMNLANTTF